MLAYGAAVGTVEAAPPRELSAGVRRLARIYIWITIASGAVVFSEPAPYDALMVGAALLLPVAGLVTLGRGLALYLLLWAAVVAGGLISTTQAGIFDVPTTHIAITFYLSFTSVVMAAFVADRPRENIRLIMSAYLISAVMAAVAALIGYFSLLPGSFDLFTEYGRARGTFKDPNVLGAFLVPPLLYAFNALMYGPFVRAGPWLTASPILLAGSVLAFSRGAWINLAVSLVVYACFTFTTVPTNRMRMKLMVYVVLAAVVGVGVFATAQSIPQIADLLGQRASLTQSYDVGPQGRFGGQQKAIELMAAHPLGIGAQEFARSYHEEDVHEVYLSMFLNAGWLGGTLYLAAVLLTIGLGLRQVLRDRGSDGISAAIVAAFVGMAFEGAVIDTDHWRHFYLLMAMIWGMALATPEARRRSRH